jgi:hypothetical protein
MNTRAFAAAAMAAGLGLSLAAAPTLAASPKAVGTLSKSASSKVARNAPTAAAPLDPAAVAALQRMGSYLSTLTAFEVTADTTLDLVMTNDQLVQVGGSARYKVRRPNNFVIDVDSDLKKRRYIYDGKQFTVFSPDQNLYASAPAPGTIRETLDRVYEKLGVALPLEDLFRWSQGSTRPNDLKSGFGMGRATIDGTPVDQYVFREGDIDWQIWIKTGPDPLPLKVVITDRTDPAHPTYQARLKWNVSPSLGDADFAFQPPAEARRINFASSN